MKREHFVRGEVGPADNEKNDIYLGNLSCHTSNLSCHSDMISSALARSDWFHQDLVLFPPHEKEPGHTNLADYYTKHHPPCHHKRVRPVYTYTEQSPVSLQGCIELLSRHLAKRAKGAKHSQVQA